MVRDARRPIAARLNLADIRIVESTGSTNADLLKAVADGVPWPDGAWLVARRQRAGRGRLGRQWAGNDGNFHGSVTLRLRPGDPPAHTLSLVAALAVYRAVTSVAPQLAGALELKWPNDLLLGGGKLAGILIERLGDHVVIGCGVNLAHAPVLDDRLTAALKPPVAVEPFAEALASAWEHSVADWRAMPLPHIVGQWKQRAHAVGTRLAVSASEHGALTGTYDGLEDDGRLRLRTDAGTMLLIGSGEVTLPSAS